MSLTSHITPPKKEQIFISQMEEAWIPRDLSISQSHRLRSEHRSDDLGLATPLACRWARLPPIHTFQQSIAVRLKNGVTYVKAC